jgi:hypothetical protein
MLRKLINSGIAVVVILALSIAPVAATGQTSKDLELVRKAKAKIAKLNLDEKARLEVKLKDGSVLKGYPREESDEHFMITDPKTGSTTRVAYDQVKSIKGPTPNLRKEGPGWLGIALIPTILLLSLWTKNKD